MPDSSVSGIARCGARADSSSRACATIITTKKSALATSALAGAQPGDAIAPASAGPTARATLKATAPSATARGSVDAADEVVDARRLRRQVECETGADQEREGEERRRA